MHRGDPAQPRRDGNRKAKRFSLTPAEDQGLLRGTSMGFTFRRVTTAVCCLLTLSASFAAGGRDPDLRSLYETHQWFRLRDAVRETKAPAFYRGAVACAFDDFDPRQ